MKLYCTDCNATHDFSAGEIERIVYALQGDLADALMKADGLPWEGLPEESLECLESVLGGSYDSEVYQEWTQAHVERRRADEARREVQR